MFEIIQLLRSADRPTIAAALATALEVTVRTVYRDIAALQAMRVPIEGAAGVGYVMRRGYDLPPLMFTPEEIEAVVVGLALLRRTGDVGLEAAARRVGDKIATILPEGAGDDFGRGLLHASGSHTMPASEIDFGCLRRAVREQEELEISYTDDAGRATQRTIKPLALVYYVNAVVLAAWCGLRRDFRHFRVDRMADFQATGRYFGGEADTLRAAWQRDHQLS